LGRRLDIMDEQNGNIFNVTTGVISSISILWYNLETKFGKNGSEDRK